MRRPTRARRISHSLPRCLADALEARVLLAADAAAMVKDINPVSGPSVPDPFIAFRGATYFRALDGVHGVEWFRTDGTAAGTSLLADIYPGAGSSTGGLTNGDGAVYAAVAGDSLFFTAYEPGTGAELWKTDGTTAGTVRVKDLVPGPSSSTPQNLIAVGSTLYFAATDGVTHAVQIWKSDGTDAGTQTVTSGAPVSSANPVVPLAALGTRLLFAANVPASATAPAGRELWVTDGTAAGTTLLKDINPLGASDPGVVGVAAEAVVSSGAVYFAATDRDHGRELWKTDGTPEGTVQVADLAPGTASSTPTHLTDVNGTLYFVAQVPVSGPGFYRVEKGSGAVTRLGSLSSASVSTGGAGGVFYAAGEYQGGTALLRNDPASPPAAGLAVVKQFAPGVTWPIDPHPIMDDGGQALFMAPGVADPKAHLWRSDGTLQGTVDLANFAGQSLQGDGRTALWRLAPGAGGLFYFNGDDGVTGMEPYRTDGTAAGTGRLIDLNPLTRPSNPGPYVFLGGPGAGRTVFAADDGQHGFEPWVTDGTDAGTALLKDIQPGRNSSFFSFADFSAPVDGRTYFITTGLTGFGTRLWATDGTPAGTVMVRDFGTTLGVVRPIVPLDGKVYFLGDGTGTSGVWVSDGTPSGTQLIVPANRIYGQLMPYGDALYFLRIGDDLSVNLWKTDGTAGGTAAVARLSDADPTFASTAATLDGVLYFLAPAPPGSGSGAVALWRTDGTASRTLPVKEVPAALEYVVAAGHRLYLSSHSSGASSLLWTSDGTAGGTGPLSSFVPALEGFSHATYFGDPELTAAGPNVYLLGQTPSGGAGVWQTDGTPGGTRRVVAVPPETATRAIGAADGIFYFSEAKSATAWFPGVLWRTDGTDAGTAAVADVSDPGFGAAGDRIYFTGTDATHGAELWSMARSAAPASATARVFYNHSDFDGNNPAATAGDVVAVATDKAPLLPGQPATFANVTSYDKGINGILLDLPAGAVGSLGAGDFTFEVSRDGGAWTAAPAPSAVAPLPTLPADRITRYAITWPDRSIANGWLRVTVPANDRTALPAPAVFRFGNLVGETGDGDGSGGWRVTAIDLATAMVSRSNATSVLHRADFNRDGRVNAIDLAWAYRSRNNALPLPPPSAAPALAARAVRRPAEELGLAH